MITTTYVYDDQEHPDRVTSTIASPAYTPQDRALLMGLEGYEASLCKCGIPRSVAWHSDMDGWYEAESFVCHACTALRDDDENTVYQNPIDTRGPDMPPLPPFEYGVTTFAS